VLDTRPLHDFQTTTYKAFLIHSDHCRAEAGPRRSGVGEQVASSVASLFPVGGGTQATLLQFKTAAVCTLAVMVCTAVFAGFLRGPGGGRGAKGRRRRRHAVEKPTYVSTRWRLRSIVRRDVWKRNRQSSAEHTANWLRIPARYAGKDGGIRRVRRSCGRRGCSSPKTADWSLPTRKNGQKREAVQTLSRHPSRRGRA